MQVRGLVESEGVAGLQASGSDEAWQVRESAEPT